MAKKPASSINKSLIRSYGDAISLAWQPGQDPSGKMRQLLHQVSKDARLSKPDLHLITRRTGRLSGLGLGQDSANVQAFSRAVRSNPNWQAADEKTKSLIIKPETSVAPRPRKPASLKSSLEAQMSGITDRTSAAGAKSIARGSAKQIEKKLAGMSSRARADLGGQFMGGDVRKWSEMTAGQQAEVISKAGKASTAARMSDIGRGVGAVTKAKVTSDAKEIARTEARIRADAQVNTNGLKAEANPLQTRAAPEVKTEAAPPVQPLRERVRAAYKRVAAQPRDWVYLSDIHAQLDGATKAEIDSTLKEMYHAREINLTLKENQSALTKAHRSAAVRLGVDDMHLLRPDTNFEAKGIAATAAQNAKAEAKAPSAKVTKATAKTKPASKMPAIVRRARGVAVSEARWSEGKIDIIKAEESIKTSAQAKAFLKNKGLPTTAAAFDRMESAKVASSAGQPHAITTKPPKGKGGPSGWSDEARAASAEARKPKAGAKSTWYHITTADKPITQLKPSSTGSAGPGVYVFGNVAKSEQVTMPTPASPYARVMQVEVDGKIRHMTAADFNALKSVHEADIAKYFKAKGFVGATFASGGARETVIFDESKVRVVRQSVPNADPIASFGANSNSDQVRKFQAQRQAALAEMAGWSDEARASSAEARKPLLKDPDVKALIKEADLKSTAEKSRVPRIIDAADAVIVDKKGNVALIERGKNGGPGAGKLALPGGIVDPGETRSQAAVREAFEETGAKLKKGKAVGKPMLTGDVRTYDPKYDPTGELAAKHGLKPGDKFRMRTQAFRFDVNDLGKMGLKAGDDATSVAIRRASSITPDALGIKHHHGLLSAALKGPTGWSDEARAASAEARKPAKPRKAAAAPKADVKAIAARLEKALGSSTFESTLKAETKGMKAAEVKELAKHFTKVSTRSKSDALTQILNKSSNLLEADRHVSARGGRVASVAGLLAAPVIAAAIAYDSTKNTAMASGKDGKAATGDALKAAAGAGAGAAAVTAGIVGGFKLAAKAAPTVGRVASRAFLPLTAAMAAYEVGRGAVEGFKKDGVSGALKGGAMGGADFLTFGAASHIASRKVRGEGQRDAVSMASRGLKKADRKPRDPKSDGFVEGFSRRQNGKMVTVQTRKMTAKEMARRFAQ